MEKIIYGRDTKSIEDYDQCVVVLVPDGMDSDELAEGLDEAFSEFETQTIVTWEDVRDSFILAMQEAGIPHQTRRTIVATVFDAVDNHD